MGGCGSSDRVADAEPSPTGASGAIDPALHPIAKPVLAKYTVNCDEPPLGRGAFSVVRRATPKTGGRAVAIKIIPPGKMGQNELDGLREEISILQSLEHANIVRCLDFFELPDARYVVMEMMSGGELFDRIVDRQYYNEGEARSVLATLLRTLKYLHTRSPPVAHRDLKPENLLLARADDDSAIKLADFGFACRLPGGRRELTKQCGTPQYVAPEIIAGTPYGVEVDLWSAGVIFYILLVGYPPFYEEDFDDLYNKIEAAAFDFDDELWERVSPEAKELIGRLLTADPFKRFTAEQALAHAWFGLSDSELRAKQLDGAHRKMKAWNARRRLKTTAKLVLLSRKRTKDMGSVVGSRMLAMGASAQAGSVPAAADAAAPSAPAELEAPPGEHESREAEPTAAE